MVSKQKNTTKKVKIKRKKSNRNNVSNNQIIEKYKILKKMMYVLIALIIIILSLYLQPILTNSLKPNFGTRLIHIDNKFSSANLAIINNASNKYYEIAGQKLLNHSLNDPVLPISANKKNQYPLFIVNNKPSIIYIGAITCIYCGENRWAMALALSKFGSFNKLFYGYSSFGDHDVPTIYWNKYNYTTNSGLGYANYYSSKYINFISADYESNIKKGFVLPLTGLLFFIQKAPNQTYKRAFEFMNSTNKFEGTPFTLWGTTLDPGADAIVFGNSTPSSSKLPLTFMTHQQVLNQLKTFNDQFAYAEYAAADVYITYICASINNTAPICSLPVIKELEIQMNLVK